MHKHKCLECSKIYDCDSNYDSAQWSSGEITEDICEECSDRLDIEEDDFRYYL